MDEKQLSLCERVLDACRGELSSLYPALDGAFSALPCRIGGTGPYSTDGEYFYCSPALLSLYAADPAALRRGYLHVLIHCLYLHILPPTGTEESVWSLAADIWTEYLIRDLHEPRLGTQGEEVERCLEMLEPRCPPVEQLVKMIEEGFFPFEKVKLRELFAFDDHGLWYGSTPAGVRQKWEAAMAFASKEGSGQGQRGSKAGEEEAEAEISRARPYDYRKYLRKFTVPREELETDDESFDYIYYNLGLTRYGNLPLIEPLEYKEVWRLDQLVIAIDTSGSCSLEMVARFLSETYSILSSHENFFRRMNVVFIQCDCCIQEETIIRSPEQWKDYCANLKIYGRGGTDFRPVFDEIEKLRERGRITKPKALLYYTDGDGVYPSSPPDYETVFIMTGENSRYDLAPKWAKLLEI